MNGAINKTLSWGEIINSIRSLHMRFYQNFPYEYKDITLKTEFVFPQSLGSFGDWSPLEAIDIVELHPVERKLLEGPLSPNEEISVALESEVSFIFKQILLLEREWLAQMSQQSSHFLRPEVQSYLEQSLLRIQNSFCGKPALRAL